MKRIISLLLVLCLVSGIAGCGSNDTATVNRRTPRSDDDNRSSVSDSADTPSVPAIPAAAEPEEDEPAEEEPPAPAREEVSAAEIDSMMEYLKDISSDIYIGVVPPFENIREIDIDSSKFLMLFREWTDGVHALEQADFIEDTMTSWGEIPFYYPENFEKLFKENFNQNFSIEDYDYKNWDSFFIWFEEKGAIGLIRGDGGGNFDFVFF